MGELQKRKKSPLNFLCIEKDTLSLISRLSVPILIELLLSTAFNMIDQMMAGQYSTDALVALGLYSTPSTILNVAFTAINVGTTVRIAWSIGAKKYKTARKITTTSISLNVLVSIVITAVCMFVAPLAITFQAGDTCGSVSDNNSVASMAVDVFRICSAGVLFSSVTSAVTGALRGAGENRVPLYYNIFASFLNVVGNYAFIYGVEGLGIPEMGAQGAALSTTLSHLVRCVISVTYLCCSKKSQLGFKNIQSQSDFNEEASQSESAGKMRFLPDGKITKSILGIGIPSAIESLIIWSGFLLLSKITVSTGQTPYAAHQVIISINGLFLLVGTAFSSTANTIVGQRVGAKDLDGVRYYVSATTKLAVIVSVVMSVVMWLSGDFLISLYTKDAEVSKIAVKLLYVAVVVIVFNNIMNVFSGALRGTGDTKFPVYVAIVSVFILRVALAYLTVNIIKMGIMGVWVATVTDNGIRCLIMIFRYKSGRWKKRLSKEEI